MTKLVSLPVDVAWRLIAMAEGREPIDDALLDEVAVSACEASGCLTKDGLVAIPYMSEKLQG